jgi:flavin-binding protein dodecin
MKSDAPRRLIESICNGGATPMDHNVYKTIEITGTSGGSLEDAIAGAVSRAAQTVRNLRWFEVIETRGSINGDQVAQWQVTLKIGFALDE